MFKDSEEGQTHYQNDGCPEHCNHEIGRKAVGGFAGHEHIHPTGEQICLICGKTLEAIIQEAREEGREKIMKTMCEFHGEQEGKLCPLCPSATVPPISSDKVWSDAIDASYTSKVRTILIHFSDALGYDDSPEHRDAWNKAFGDLIKLFRSI